MSIQGLYRLDESYYPKLGKILSDCFMEDPLFVQMVPDKEIREALLPRYFDCYLRYFSPYCHIYAESEALGGVLILYDENDEYAEARYLFSALKAGLAMVGACLKSDNTPKTTLGFLRSLRYLKSSWVSRAVNKPGLHIDFLAVRKDARGKGVASRLIGAVLDEATRRELPTTLETHNPSNLPIYRHFGFRTVFEMPGRELCQYCMVK